MSQVKESSQGNVLFPSINRAVWQSAVHHLPIPAGRVRTLRCSGRAGGMRSRWLTLIPSST